MKLEIQGRTVEVDDRFADLDADEQQRTVDEIARSMGVMPEPQITPEETAVMLAAPATTAAGMAATVPSMNTIYQQGIKPFGSAVPGALGAYVREPVKAAVDVGAMLLGSPVPPVGAIEAGKSVKNAFEAGRQVVSNISEAMSRLPPGTEDIARPFVQELTGRQLATFTDLVNRQGLEQAFRNFDPTGMSPAAQQSFRATSQAFPSTMTRVSRAVVPALGAVARVAGPAGMAYDVYQAGELARETQLGPRLASGQGQRAEQAYRGGLGMTYQGPALSPEQAQAVMQSGSARDIQYFGGQDQLTQLMRRRAAERVLMPVAGPIAPAGQR